MRVYQAVWTAPVSNRVLVEAAFSGLGFLYGREKPGNNREPSRSWSRPGRSRSLEEWRPTVSWTPRARGLLAYVTGRTT